MTPHPEIVAGRAPERPDEVALGAVTLRAAHKHIGDRVTASQQGGTAPTASSAA